jgi:hypothetical protein
LATKVPPTINPTVAPMSAASRHFLITYQSGPAGMWVVFVGFHSALRKIAVVIC